MGQRLLLHNRKNGIPEIPEIPGDNHFLTLTG